MLEILRGEHHGIPLNFAPERRIKATEDEAKDGVFDIGVVLAWCQKGDCKKVFIYSRHYYVGGPGPFHRHRDPKVISQLKRRLREAKESDWVMSSRHEYPYTATKAWVK